MFDIRKIQEQSLYEAVKAESDETTAKEIVFGKEKQTEEADSDWVKSSMHRLEHKFDSKVIKNIRMKCQCHYGMEEKIALLKELKESSTTIEELAANKKAAAAGLFCKGNELFLQFNHCPCPILMNVDILETSSWCQCTTGYSKYLFETAFACHVDVELLQSIKMGNPICLMKIILHHPVWLTD